MSRLPSATRAQLSPAPLTSRHCELATSFGRDVWEKPHHLRHPGESRGPEQGFAVAGEYIPAVIARRRSVGARRSDLGVAGLVAVARGAKHRGGLAAPGTPRASALEYQNDGIVCLLTRLGWREWAAGRTDV